MTTCPVCKEENAQFGPKTFDGEEVTCRRCGSYSYVGSITTELPNLDASQRALLSGWVREQAEAGSPPRLKSGDIERILQFSRPTLKERAQRLLTHIARHQKQLGDTFDNTDQHLVAVAYAADRRELLFVFRYLQDQKLVESRTPTTPEKMRITPAGHAHIDELGLRNEASPQGFVAMYFDNALSEIYVQGFDPGIRAAGYRPFRIDRHEHVNRIDDEIIAQIRRSRFVVADFTGHRGGVYFEAGFAVGLNLPVIWTCRRADMANLHFDIRQFNCLGWETVADLVTPLQMRIEAVIGRGPVLAR